LWLRFIEQCKIDFTRPLSRFKRPCSQPHLGQLNSAWWQTSRPTAVRLYVLVILRFFSDARKEKLKLKSRLTKQYFVFEIMLLQTLQILTLFVSMESMQVNDSVGIFLRLNANAKIHCQKTVYSRDHKLTACIPKSPIITPSDFKSVTKIVNDEVNKISYFNLVLTPEGLDKLKLIATTLPETELVLVVNNQIAGTFTNLDQIKTRRIQIAGEANSADVVWIYDELTEVLLQIGMH
jgi:hypothetical protein